MGPFERDPPWRREDSRRAGAAVYPHVSGGTLLQYVSGLGHGRSGSDSSQGHAILSQNITLRTCGGGDQNTDSGLSASELLLRDQWPRITPIHYLVAGACLKRYIAEEESRRINSWMNPLAASAALGMPEILAPLSGRLGSTGRSSVLDALRPILDVGAHTAPPNTSPSRR